MLETAERLVTDFLHSSVERTLVRFSHSVSPASLDPAHLVLGSVAWGLTVGLLAQAVAPPQYVWQYQTLSELAGQGYGLKWIMQASMLGYGGMLFYAALLRVQSAQRRLGPVLMLMLYAGFIVLCGAFSTRSFDGTPPASPLVMDLHIAMICAAGIAVGGAVLWSHFAETDPRLKGAHLLTLLTLVVLALLYALANWQLIALGKGLPQRAFHIVCLIWITATYGRLDHPVGTAGGNL